MSWPDGSSFETFTSEMDGAASVRSDGSRQKKAQGKRQALPPPDEAAAPPAESGKRRRRTSTAPPALPSAAPVPPTAEPTDEEPTMWVSDSQLREYMAQVEPVRAGRSYTNKLPARIIRLAFYGMFRKGPQRLDGLEAGLNSFLDGVIPMSDFIISIWHVSQYQN